MPGPGFAQGWAQVKEPSNFSSKMSKVKTVPKLCLDVETARVTFSNQTRMKILNFLRPPLTVSAQTCAHQEHSLTVSAPTRLLSAQTIRVNHDLRGPTALSFFLFSRIFGVCARVFTSIWGVAVRKILNHRDQFAFLGKNMKPLAKLHYIILGGL